MKKYHNLIYAMKECRRRMGDWVLIEDNSEDYTSLRYDGCGGWSLVCGGVDCDGQYGTPSCDWEAEDIISILCDYNKVEV